MPIKFAIKNEFPKIFTSGNFINSWIFKMWGSYSCVTQLISINYIKWKSVFHNLIDEKIKFCKIYVEEYEFFKIKSNKIVFQTFDCENSALEN